MEMWAHQKKAAEKAKALALKGEGFSFFFDPGTGKTRTLIEVLRFLYNRKKTVHRTFIFCPPIVIQNWKDEWLKFSNIQEDLVIPLLGSGRERLKKFKALAWKDGVPQGRIFITNYEGLLMKPLYEAIIKWNPRILGLDEGHKCKERKAQRTKKMLKLTSGINKSRGLVYNLTGTPILNSPMDIFSQFLLVDNGRTFGGNFVAFRSKYFYDKNAGMPKQRYFPDWVIREGALAEISEKMQRTSMCAKKSECLDLPPLVEKTILVEMSAEQRRLYEEMRKDFVAFLEDDTIVATMALTKALRLMQIASGYAKTTRGDEKTLDDVPKMVALKELLQQLAPNHKVIVWAVWKENYEQIKKVCEDLRMEYVEVHGGVSSKNKFKNVDTFKNNDKVRVLIGHPGSGGIGINLVVASYSIVFSRNFSLEYELQAEARNHRGGSEIHEKITKINLVCKNSIDELILDKLKGKHKISLDILRKIKSEL